jgi:hypothetical protein
MAEDMRYWLRATTTVADDQRAVAYENNARCAQGHHEHAGVVLEAVRDALARLRP